MSLTCCTGFQRVVEALNEFQIRNRKFKPAFLLTGFTVTTDASLLLRVFLQFARLVLVLHLRKIGEVVIFFIPQHKILIAIKKSNCSIQGTVSTGLYFYSVNLLLLSTFSNLLMLDRDVYWMGYSLHVAFIVQFH